ncbi:MAG: hypothetical protein M3134_00845 [Actinomycetota bacterium]|nr:hypothetical protein [Actinomycetota bacterium]
MRRNQAGPGLMTPPSGAAGKFYGVARLGFGALSVALAFDSGWTGGDVAFASDGSRVVFGATGALVAVLGLRGLVRAVNERRREVTPQSLRWARAYGGVVFAVGLWYEIASWSDGAVRLGIGLDSWAGPVYGLGGLALMLQGVALQIDPTPFIKRSNLLESGGDVVTATIVRARDLGAIRGGRAKVQFEFTMDAGNGVERHSAKWMLDHSRLARIEGGTVDVVVDRADPTVWVVKWDTLRERHDPDR